MENLNAEKIDNYIDEFFLMERGEKISNPNGKILFFGEICVSRRSLKHVVEQRSINDGLDANGIKLLARKVRKVLANPEIVIKSNSKKYPRSYIYGGFDLGTNQGIMAIVDHADEWEACLITVFYKEVKPFLKLINKNNP